MNLNRITLMGIAGKDAEVRFTQNGTCVLNFSIATSKNIAKQGEPPKWASTWHKIVVWGKVAERFQHRIKKGCRIYVEGELEIKEWEKDGIKRYSPEVTARVIALLDQEKTKELEENPLDDLPF